LTIELGTLYTWCSSPFSKRP